VDLPKRPGPFRERDCTKSEASRSGVRLHRSFLFSPDTLESGASQWMELAYADAFEVKTFILLHHLKFLDLKEKATGVPPLLLSSQCNSAMEWKKRRRKHKRVT